MSNGIKVILIIILIGACVLVGMVWNAASPNVTQGEEVGMIQPKGYIFSQEYDKNSSEVNQGNAQANADNGLSHVYNAQATQIVSQANDTAVNRAATLGSAIGTTVFMYLCGGLLTLLVIGYIWSAVAR